mgnify:FL=1
MAHPTQVNRLLSASSQTMNTTTMHPKYPLFYGKRGYVVYSLVYSQFVQRKSTFDPTQAIV